MFEKILNVLRKLGILRFGASAGTYTSMQDRPAELLQDGVFDAKKDLINGDTLDQQDKKDES